VAVDLNRCRESPGYRSSGGAPLVTMMEPAQLRNRDDPSPRWRVDRLGLRAVLLQCQMRSAPMVVVAEAVQVSVRTALIESDHVMVGTVMKATDTILFTRLSRNVFQVWDGGLLWRTKFLLTLVSPISIPSLSSSRNNVSREGSAGQFSSNLRGTER
jgi:hypothetical protein